MNGIDRERKGNGGGGESTAGRRRRKTRSRRRRGSQTMMVSARFIGGVMVMAITLFTVHLAAIEAPRERRFATDADTASGTVEERFMRERDIDLLLFVIERKPQPILTVSYSTPSGPERITAEVAGDFYEKKQVGRRVRVEYILGEDDMVRIAGSEPVTTLRIFLVLVGLGSGGLFLFLAGPAFWKGRYI